MLEFLTLALIGASSNAETPPLYKLVEIVEPYVACRVETDRKIVVLQQQLRSKRQASEAYDVYADPTYHELNAANSKAEQSCDLPKYTALIANAWGKSASYDEWQSRTQAELFIQDIVQAQWSALSFQTGTYQFPVPRVTYGTEKPDAQN